MTVGEKLDRSTRLLKAISHPLRQKILVSLNRGVASPSQLATELGEPLGNVSYHVKILEDYEAIELVDTAPRRGAVEHFYRAIARPHIDDEHWSRLPLSTRRALFDQTLQQLWDHMVEAGEREGYDDPRTHISWTTLELDETGYDEMAELLRETLARSLELQVESAGRLNELPSSERRSRRTVLAIAHFDRR